VLTLEFAPLLNRIMTPPSRPVRNLSILHFYERVTLCTTQVNSQVICPEEKAMLSRLMNIMVSLGLNFVQERAEDGQIVYRLDPWVWGLCSFWLVVADVRQQASGFIRDIRRQARRGYSPSALWCEAPCGHRGQSTLTLCQELVSGAMATACPTHRLFI
jgi:hypothetical protein